MNALVEFGKIKRGDLEFETDKFVLKKGETVALKVELLPGKIQVVQGDKVIGAKDLPQTGAGASRSTVSSARRCRTSSPPAM